MSQDGLRVRFTTERSHESYGHGPRTIQGTGKVLGFLDYAVVVLSDDGDFYKVGYDNLTKIDESDQKVGPFGY